MAASKQKIITKKSLADDLSAKFDMTKKDANAVVEYIFDEIADTIEKGGEASINRFGKFSRVKKKAWTARKRHTREEIKVKASYAPKFKPSKTLKEQVK